MHIRGLLYIFCLSIPFTGISQDIIKDSLLFELEKAETPRDKAKLNGDLSIYYYDNQVYHDSAYFYNDRAYTIALDNNLKNEEARALFNFGLIYARIDDYDIALDYYARSYELFTDVGTTANLSVVNSSMAGLYFDKEEYAKAKEYFEKAMELSRKQNDSLSLAIDYVNLGQTEYRMEAYESSKINIEDGLQLLENLNFPISAARIYYGNTLLALDRKEEAKIQAELGFKLANKEGNVEFIADASKLLYELSLKEENYEKALEYYENYIVHKDSLNEARELNSIEKLRLNFVIDQKEKDIQRLLERNKYLSVIYVLLGLGVLLLIFLTFKQRKVVKMTSSMMEIQNQLVGDELKKRQKSS